jgi:ATP-binding cassette, sub-family E, member 1
MAKRIAVVDKKRCNPVGCGGYLCMKFCPINRKGEPCIYKDTDNKIGINEEICIGCNICVAKCPFGAIKIINLPEQLSKDPIFRYGKNGFALYNLPIPLFGKVVGIIGRNGIGKSTAIKILAGLLKPNLGKETEATQKEIVDYFKGTEAHGFFDKVHQGLIKISYKPQQVDLIPKQFSGTVRELLTKVDEKKGFEKIIKDLELEQIVDSDIKHISGGEMQRVAIAATVLKNANVYFFDEPTSYLDIKQRLKVSTFIRSLADEKTAVMVIEHDLIILDSMSDMVHLMYGHEAAYGIVSHVKTTKAGINIYLDGYLKDENVRFRDTHITFEPSIIAKEGRREKLTAWDGFEEKLGRFTLKAKEGTIHRNTIVGILGENGIGKTTFVKLLAGVQGTKSLSIKVAYKSQYLEANDELVMIVLQKAMAKYENQLIRPLQLKHLFERKLNELSGGELQRVAIAHCLSQDAELFLLDEPSAYLDVEQRLSLSKVIKDLLYITGKSALIVDHDLLFLDYLSDELLVFEGMPAIEGNVEGPFAMEEGMNMFLKDLEITFRRDEETHRPRSNKLDSQKDAEQKKSGKLYYT